MKHNIQIIRDNNTFNVAYLDNNLNIDYFIDNLLAYNLEEIKKDNSICVELRGDNHHQKFIFTIFEDIIQEMIINNYNSVICEVQYKNIKNNNIDTLINNYDTVTRNAYLKNKYLVIKYLETN